MEEFNIFAIFVCYVLFSVLVGFFIGLFYYMAERERTGTGLGPNSAQHSRVGSECGASSSGWRRRVRRRVRFWRGIG